MIGGIYRGTGAVFMYKAASTTATNSSETPISTGTWIELQIDPPSLFDRMPAALETARAEPQWCVRCRKRKQFAVLCSFCSAVISRVPVRSNAQVRAWKRRAKRRKKGRD